MRKSALEMLDEAVLALEAEGYKFYKKEVDRSAWCTPLGSKTKQTIELFGVKHLPAEEIPPEFKKLTSFSKGLNS
jgi:hypothetical protein